MQTIFVVAEKYFLIQTHNKNKVIAITNLVDKLMKFGPIQESFKLLVDKCDFEPSKEIVENVLKGSSHCI